MSFKYLIALCLWMTPFLKDVYGNDLSIETNEKVQKVLNSKTIDNFQKYETLFVAAKDMQNIKNYKKSQQYYELAINNIPKTLDPFALKVDYLAMLYQWDKEKAKTYFEESLKELSPRKSKSKEEKEKKTIFSFWENVFSSKVKPESHKGFFGEFFKDRDIKTLINEGDFKKAYGLLSPQGLRDASINEKLQFDVISFLNGKTNSFFCEDNLNQFKDSSAITLDICRLLLKKPIKNGSLSDIKTLVDGQLPHLSYLLNPLIDRRRNK